MTDHTPTPESLSADVQAVPAEHEALRAACVRFLGVVSEINLQGGWRADCPKCVASKFTCDEHFRAGA